MSPAVRAQILQHLGQAFGGARDVSPSVEQPLHVMLTRLELPEPWIPSPTRAISVWENWPNERPRFAIDMDVVGEGGDPPRSNEEVYFAGAPWRGFSFSFPWRGDNPVVAIQLWLTRFLVERS